MDPNNYPNWADWNSAVQRVDALTVVEAAIGIAVLLLFVLARRNFPGLLAKLRVTVPVLFYGALFFVALGKLWKLW